MLRMGRKLFGRARTPGTGMAFLCLTMLTVASPPGFGQILVRDVSVIPMTSKSVAEHQDVLIDDGRIVTIGDHGSLQDVPDLDQTIAGAGRYLIPGLCDLHIHVKGRRDEIADGMFLYPANGVTTVLNMGGNAAVLRLRDAIAKGNVLGPRLFTASPILGNVSPTPATYEDGRDRVREFYEAGYDFIKVYNYIPEDGYRGIVDEAKKLGIPVVGHAVRSVGIEGAIASGQDIAHMEEIIYGYFGDDLDETRIRPLARRLKAAGIDVITTLIAYHNILRQLDDIDAMLASPGIQYLPGSVTRTFQPELNPYLNSFDETDEEKLLRPSFAFLQTMTKEFQEEGVRLLAGTDATIEIVVPGFSLHDELAELVDAGLTPYEALKAATVSPAAFLGKPEEFGTLEPGKSADAVLLRTNPLENIDNSRAIEGVFLRGCWLSRAEIDQRLNRIAEAVKTE